MANHRHEERGDHFRHRPTPTSKALLNSLSLCRSYQVWLFAILPLTPLQSSLFSLQVLLIIYLPEYFSFSLTLLLRFIVCSWEFNSWVRYLGNFSKESILLLLGISFHAFILLLGTMVPIFFSLNYWTSVDKIPLSLCSAGFMYINLTGHNCPVVCSRIVCVFSNPWSNPIKRHVAYPSSVRVHLCLATFFVL